MEPKHKATYLVGSHMYGLETPQSDQDYLTVYFDYLDYVRPVRKLPEVLETDNNNTKLYSLVKFATLLLKGNPNIVDVVSLTPLEQNSKHVSWFMTLMRANPNLLITENLLSACAGHLIGIMREIETKGVTPKRLSHALRLKYTLEHFLNTQTLFSLKDYPLLLEECRRIKTTPASREAEAIVSEDVCSLVDRYAIEKKRFPNNSALTELINDYFEEIYL